MREKDKNKFKRGNVIQSIGRYVKILVYRLVPNHMTRIAKLGNIHVKGNFRRNFRHNIAVSDQIKRNQSVKGETPPKKNQICYDNREQTFLYKLYLRSI